MELALYMNHEDLVELQLPIIVEQWDNIAAVNAPGRKRKIFKELFTEKERRKLRVWHNKIHQWYLVKGFPQTAYISFQDRALLKRATDLFASL